MQKINIIGGGPAGLYFAILMKETNPAIQITIYERNGPDDTFGWGIVLTAGTMGLLKKCDQASYEDILKTTKRWSNVDIYHLHDRKTIHGREYHSMSRLKLLKALRKRCNTLGIDIEFQTTVKQVEDLYNCDLLVGADGANSIVREKFKDIFQPSIDVRKNKYIWLGTHQLFNTMSLMFKKHTTGIFTAEAYIFDDNTSTFIAQCSPATWKNSGFEQLSISETTAYLADIFKDELDGNDLMWNSSVTWNNFPFIKNNTWSHPKVLLLGDALHTAHFSIGSGTRLALEDAIVAANSINESGQLETSLKKFEAIRRPYIENYQDAAFTSLKWFENLDNVIDLDMIPFTYEVMTRSKKVDIRSIKIQDPVFAHEYLDYIHKHEAAAQL